MHILQNIKGLFYLSTETSDIDGRFYTLTASRVIANIGDAKESLQGTWLMKYR